MSEAHIETVAALRERLALLPGDMPVALAYEGCWAQVGRVFVEGGVAYILARYERTDEERRAKAEEEQ